MNIDRIVIPQYEEGKTPELGHFTPSTIEQLPSGILKESGNEINLNEIESVASAAHDNGVVTYRISMHPTQGKEPHQAIYFVDYAEAKEAGYLRVDHTDQMSFARNIRTDDAFEGKGLAAQRLIMAHQYCLERYGQELYSGLATLTEGRSLWKSLIAKGFVEPTGNVINHLYRFKANLPPTDAA